MRRRVTGARLALVAGWLAACSVAAGCADWPWLHDMKNQPSPSLASSSRPPAAGSLPISGETPLDREAADARLRNPIASAMAEGRGRALYEAYCVPCHGANGEADGPVSKYFGRMRHLTDPEVQQHGDGWLFATISNGTDRMPRYANELTPAERWQIVNVIRSMAVREAARP